MKKRGRVLALLLATVLTVSSVPGTVMAADGIRPQDGTTKEQPFLSGTGGSSQFRIPCLVSLDDGTIVAGCDARWNTSGDGGGLDTIVSRSTDKGKTWHYTFANYLGDNGNAWNNYSTAFIDPAMATDGKRVYMIADLYPAGYALNSAKYPPVPGKSHDKDGNILLADASSWENCWVDARKDGNNYTYHLEKNDKKKSDSAYVIKDADGKAVDGYTVDAYFNIKGNGVDTNLFEANSPFQVWPTDYLYLTTSEDGGATWSVPTIVNARRETEQSLLVGPGRGMVTSTGRIIFTAYEYTNGDKNSVAIYSDDEGKTWTRGQSVTSQSSEAVVTEANGKLYMFTRHGGYYTSEDFGETWSPKQEMGINYRLYCQLTAITYPKKIDGKTAILFAAPSSVSDRSAGKIFVGLVQDDGKLNWKYNYSVNGSDPYGYSCLTVLPDGTVGLLYEGSGIVYEDFDIADIAKGAAIGNIWCTDENGSVAEVTMASNSSKELTVNGLKDNAEVKVSTDNDKAVTAAYANGKVTLTSKSVTGMERADITVESEGEKTTVSVTVTDAENYEVVDLRVGDTKTYTDNTGNYSGSALEGLDTNVAEVKLTGEDAQSVEKRVKAQLATSEAHFDGEEKSLDECLFTFSGVEGQENIYTMSAKDGDKTVYVNYRSAASAGTVCAETTANIKLEERSEDQSFELFDQTPSNHGNRLYFHKDNENKLHFDRNTGDDANCHMELYKKAVNGSAESAIPGYEKVTGLAQITNGGKYLIAAKSTAGAYYIVNPSSAGEKYKHVAKVIEENVPAEEEVAVALGTTKDYNDGGEKKIGKCLFTFAKQGDNGTFKISAVTDDGKTVYLGPKSSSSPQKPTVATEAVITVAKSGDGFSLEQKEGTQSSGYLYFWKDNESKLHFDRNSSVDGDGKCNFELYKKSEAKSESKIAGYEKLTEVSEIQDGGQYLIAMQATVAGNSYYLLNPSLGSNVHNYVAKVTDHMYKDETIGAKTDIAITGKAEGKTSVKIGDKTYFIFVKNDVEEVTLKIGEKFNLPGKLLNESEVTKDGIVTVEKREDMPPYKAISEIAEGTYLFGSRSHIMLNTVSTAEGTQKGLGMKAVNFNNDEIAKDFMWTIAKSGEGYTMKDAASGKYINISGNNVELKDTAQVLTISVRTNGGFAVSAGGYYLNNWAGGNNKVAAYQSDDNPWYFYKASSGNVATGAKEGTVTAETSEGINYKITVVKDVPQVKEYTVTATVNDETMGTASLDKEGPKYEENTELKATAKANEGYEFVNWTVNGKEVSKEAEYKFTVNGDMELKANFKAKETPKPPVEETYTVTTKVNDDKMGTVTLDPAKEKYNAGEKVTATATVKDESKYEFVNWTVDDKEVSKEAEYKFTVNGNMELKANFKEKEKPPVEETYTVTTKVNDDKMGTVTLDPVKEKYNAGEKVTATAKPNEGYEFVKWVVNGKEVRAQETQNAVYTFEVAGDTTLEAVFRAKEEPDTFKLNVTVNVDKMGTVKLDPAKDSYEVGENVTAIAIAKDGYKFVNWTVDGKVVSDKAEFTFKVDRALTLKANFEKVSEDQKDEDKAVQTGDNGVSPIIPLAGLAIAAGAAVTVLRKKED